VLHIDGEAVALELDRIPAAAGAARVVQLVYAVNDAVVIEIDGQDSVALNPADAFVFHPRAVGQELGVNARLRGLGDVVVAMMMFGGEID
jgi:hypothetical protein